MYGASGTEIKRGGACGVAFGCGLNSSGKLSFLHCLDNNSLKPFFQVLLIIFLHLDLDNMELSSNYHFILIS